MLLACLQRIVSSSKCWTRQAHSKCLVSAQFGWGLCHLARSGQEEARKLAKDLIHLQNSQRCNSFKNNGKTPLGKRSNCCKHTYFPLQKNGGDREFRVEELHWAFQRDIQTMFLNLGVAKCSDSSRHISHIPCVYFQWSWCHSKGYLFYKFALFGYYASWLVWTTIKECVILGRGSHALMEFNYWALVLITSHSLIISFSSLYHHVVRPKQTGWPGAQNRSESFPGELRLVFVQWINTNFLLWKNADECRFCLTSHTWDVDGTAYQDNQPSHKSFQCSPTASFPHSMPITSKPQQKILSRQQNVTGSVIHVVQTIHNLTCFAFLSRTAGSWAKSRREVDFPMSISTEPITLNKDTPNEVQVRVIMEVKGTRDDSLMCARSQNNKSSLFGHKFWNHF